MSSGDAQRLQEHIHERIHEIPPPEAKEAGWYPDPLGSTWERYWDGSWLELTRAPRARMATEAPPTASSQDNARQWSPWGLRLPRALVGRGDSEPTGPSENGHAPVAGWLRQRAEQKRAAEIEASKQAFFETPAGRARLSFGQKHRLFQFELQLAMPNPIVIPGIEGTAPQWTSDPVDILNSVISEGWKLVAGTYVYVEMRGPVGYYLFKRSKKRYRKMNDPWKAPVG
jgi:hypothetical protein